MTVDQAIAIRVRLDTATMALVRAIEITKEALGDDAGDLIAGTVDTLLHRALTISGNARGFCLSVCGSPFADPLP